MVAPHCALVKVAEVHGEGKTALGSFGRGSLGIKPQVCLPVPEGGHRGGVAEKPRLGLRRSAGVGLSLFQMTQDFPNDPLLGDEGDDAEGASTLTFQRVGLIDPLDELRPAFSEGGAVFWRQLSFVLDVGIFRAAQRLKGEVCFFPVSPRF